MRAMYGNTGLHKFEASLGYIFPVCKQNLKNHSKTKQMKQNKQQTDKTTQGST